MQKQPSERFYKNSVKIIFAKFTRKHQGRGPSFDKVRHCRSAASLKTRLQDLCFLCEICKNTFLPNTYRTADSDYSSINGTIVLREKCPNTELFLVRIQFEYRKIRTRKDSVFRHFLRSSSEGRIGKRNCNLSYKN